MAHNIEIRNGQASMFYVDEPPWHGLGKRLESPATAEEAIRAANLDWKVMKVHLYAKQGKTRLCVEGKYGIVRKDLWGKNECTVLGVVGKQYTPLQNTNAFKFFDPIVGEGAAIYHTAGVLGKGERIWILAKLPEDIRVVGDDIVNKFLLLSNSHDGTSAVQVKFTPIRVVCQNTLTMALRQGSTIRAFHLRNMPARLRQAENLLGIVRTRFDNIEKTFKAMITMKIDKDRLSDYLRSVFPDPLDPENEKAAETAQRNRLLAEYFFDQGAGNRAAGVAGTLWAAYNGVTEMIDHRKRRQTGERRLNSIWFGDSCSIKVRAFNMANEKIGAWRN